MEWIFLTVANEELEWNGNEENALFGTGLTRKTVYTSQNSFAMHVFMFVVTQIVLYLEVMESSELEIVVSNPFGLWSNTTVRFESEVGCFGIRLNILMFDENFAVVRNIARVDIIMPINDRSGQTTTRSKLPDTVVESNKVNLSV